MKYARHQEKSIIDMTVIQLSIVDLETFFLTVSR